MLNIGKIIGKFIKNSSQRDIDKLEPIVKQINAWESKIKDIPDEKFTEVVEYIEFLKKNPS